MGKIILTALFLAITVLSNAAIYKWVDENGTTHYTDSPSQEDIKKANKIKLQEKLPPVIFHLTEEQRIERDRQSKEFEQEQQDRYYNLKTSPKVKKAKIKNKIITENDYKISSEVHRFSGNMIEIMGRIEKGPRCKDMRVSAYAKNTKGQTAWIQDETSLSSSGGSTLFSGNVRVREEMGTRGSWEVTSVTVRCND